MIRIQSKLDKEIHRYRMSLLKKKTSVTDTTVAIISTTRCCCTYGKGISGAVRHDFYNNTPELKRGLLAIVSPGQGIGGKSKLHTCNPVGNCAENKAAHDLLLKSNNRIRLKCILFSKAVRVRTFELVKPCLNCRAVFQTLKKINNG